MKKLEERATVYITLSMMISLSAKNVSAYLEIPFLEYVMIAIAVVLIILGIINVNKYEKQKTDNSCSS
ncbi:MAG: hypothetical protein AB8H03_25060 [Saprospiraceae bacterium]